MSEPTEVSLVARTADGPRPAGTITLPGAFRARYHLGPALGAGAMGVVHRARDVSMNRDVAIKFLLHVGDDELRRRFVQEGRMLAKIRHPNVVQVYDLEILDGHPCIVSEVLEGGTLRARIPMAPAEAVDVTLACLDGLAACHAAGIVHRDLKPENILFSADYVPKLTDLGIAKELAGGRLTQTGALVGTPRYMAPEQAELGHVSFASDVHAMGAIVFELITGQSPYRGASVAEVLHAIMTQPAPALDQVMSTPLPPALVRAVSRALAKRPADRPTVAELASELRRARSPERARPSRRVARPPAPMRGAVLALAGAAVFAVALTFRSVPRPAPAPTATPSAEAAGPWEQVDFLQRQLAEIDDDLEQLCVQSAGRDWELDQPQVQRIERLHGRFTDQASRLPPELAVAFLDLELRAIGKGLELFRAVLSDPRRLGDDITLVRAESRALASALDAAWDAEAQRRLQEIVSRIRAALRQPQPAAALDRLLVLTRRIASKLSRHPSLGRIRERLAASMLATEPGRPPLSPPLVRVVSGLLTRARDVPDALGALERALGAALPATRRLVVEGRP